MKVLFAYSNRVRDLLPAPPIGLSYVASATQDAGHQVRFVDLLLAADWQGNLRDELRRMQPEVVAISVRNIDNVVHQRLKTHLDELARQIEIVRQESRALIVLGGPAISILGCRSLDLIDADFALLGEGEDSFPALLSVLEAGGDAARVAGVCVRNGAVITEPVAQRSQTFGPSGMERWVDWRAYERQGSTWPIQCKRGCPLHCTYCTYPTIEGRAMRRRSPEEIVDEIRQVSRVIKPRCFEFIDAVFNMPESYAVALCEAVIRSGLKINLTTMGVNPRSMSRELLVAMKRAGFKSMMVTPESASDQVLDTMRKGFTKADVIRCAALVKESGIPSMWFFMLGSLGETQETADETVRFAEQHLNWNTCLPMFTTGIRLLPGTELAAQAFANGYLPAHQDLAESVFYFSPDVSEQWLLRRVDQAVARCPNIVHAAEDPSDSAIGGRVYRLMHGLGVAPPYWRFIPRFLSLPMVHRSRMKAKNLASPAAF